MASEPDRLERTLAQLPDLPGVYMMIGADGRILYIGKAVSLRNRVRSYFQDSAAHPYRTVKMVERVADVRTIVVTNEVEALILEANLIKRHQPPFNVRLRDDKRFPYLKVTNEPFPRVVFTRVVKDDGARYFGPYTNAHGLRELIDFVRLVFPLRTCREPIDGKRKRPCLQYHIKRCLAPCVGYQSEDDYDGLVDEVVLFLEGHFDPLIERLQGEMTDAAEHFNFEAAARLRDRIIAVRRTIEAQKVVWHSRIDVDLMALARAQGQACVEVFMVRDGKLLGQEYFILEGAGERSDAEIISEFIKQFYTARTGNFGMDASHEAEITGSPLALRAARDQQVPVAEKARARRRRAYEAAVPKEILVEARPDDASVIEAWLTEIKGRARARARAAARRARRLPEAGEEERGAEPARVPRAPRSDGDGVGERADGARRVARSARAAAPHRVLRHLEHPRHELGRLDGRVRRRPAEEERLPALQHPGGARARTTSPRCRRRCGGGCATCARTRIVRRSPTATSRRRRSKRRRAGASGSTRSRTCC